MVNNERPMLNVEGKEMKNEELKMRNEKGNTEMWNNERPILNVEVECWEMTVEGGWVGVCRRKEA
jgi:hypothetical protein